MGIVVDDIERIFDRGIGSGFGQAVAQIDKTCGECDAGRHTAASGRQPEDGVADTVGQFADGSHTFAVGLVRGGEQTTDVSFGGRQSIGDRRNFGHREGAIHGVDCAHQWLIGHSRRVLCARKPAVDGAEMTADFCLQDLEQNRIHADRNAFFFTSNGTGGEVGRYWFEANRWSRLGDCCRSEHGHHFFAAGDAFGKGFYCVQIGSDSAVAAQCRVQLRQGREGLFDHRDDR